MWPDDRFAGLLGSRLPIIAAPMAGAGGVELAVGAIAGGAVGSLPCALLTPDQMRAQVAEVRTRTTGPINLNFFCHAMPEAVDDSAWRAVLRPFYDEFGVKPVTGGTLRRPFDAASCADVEEIRPDLVSFHFGLPDDALLARVRATGARILGNATTLAEARVLAARGVDAIIAQGWEAGGHAGRFLGAPIEEAPGLIALVPQVSDATGLPVVAAGGIGDARGIAAALALGATAVQVGTAYLHCPESLIGPAHRAGLTGESAEHTGFTNLFSGGLARSLPTRLTDVLGRIRTEAPPFPLASPALAPLAKTTDGFAPMWAGQASRLGRPLPARELTETLGREALALLGRKA
ncbi:nitronate monooxygenase [Sphingosinicella sp. LHD-64]|uniref:NAD(P)H-dependent flavin oxidoreductase n=1 Tax=Sphingosinicella sp. LHD-64 TaxID=3072139 RepID=UPI00280CF661|nr:nitronate monooxygenase [Sphingosinicella sp. LHD-64]MDQ8756990.1 nitronate monooxygenase [Sphingosinicella sp. LHD-64]